MRDTPKSAIRGSPSALITMFDCRDGISMVAKVKVLVKYPFDITMDNRWNQGVKDTNALCNGSNLLAHWNKEANQNIS